MSTGPQQSSVRALLLGALQTVVVVLGFVAYGLTAQWVMAHWYDEPCFDEPWSPCPRE